MQSNVGASLKRRFHPFRIVLGLLLFAAAGLLWSLWPPIPRWTRPVENLVGFDEEAGLLYTVPRERTLNLNAYDLKSGALRWGKTLNAIPFVGLTEPEQLLSPDSTLLASCSWLDESIDVYSVATGQRLHHFGHQELDRANALRTLAFSSDSRLLIVRDLMKVIVLDLASGQIIHKHFLPREFNSSFVTAVREFGRVSISPDRRYLVASGDQLSVLMDLSTGNYCGKCLAYGPTHFLDENTVVFLSAQAKERAPLERPFVYRVSEKGFQPVPAQELDKSKRLGNCDITHGLAAFITTDLNELTIPEWVPKFISEPILKRWGTRTYWNVHSWKIDPPLYLKTYRLKLPEQYVEPIIKFPTLSDHHRVAFYSNATHMSCWGLGDWPPFEWQLLCGLIACTALWIIWPRRRHAEPLLLTKPASP